MKKRKKKRRKEASEGKMIEEGRTKGVKRCAGETRYKIKDEGRKREIMPRIKGTEE